MSPSKTLTPSPAEQGWETFLAGLASGATQQIALGMMQMAQRVPGARKASS